MIDLNGLAFEETSRRFEIKTSHGPAVLRLLSTTFDNAAWTRGMLDREAARAAQGAPEEPAPEDKTAAGRKNLDALEALAEDIHRWCFVSLTVNGEECTSEQGLFFLRMLAASATTIFLDMSASLRSHPQEASADAIAGE